ncbi:MAG: helix-turn-helix transcriptional regulator [Oscillospiraceae bacterium]|nr:helix-turn-helix transcriptional regulator [Oscillospiraceae bacterium]
MRYRRLRDLREDHDMTQKQVADKLFMHLTQYRRYETGESELPLGIAVNIADLYGVTLDYIADRHTPSLIGDRTDDEAQLIDAYRSLTERQKGKIEMYMELMRRT